MLHDIMKCLTYTVFIFLVWGGGLKVCVSIDFLAMQQGNNKLCHEVAFSLPTLCFPWFCACSCCAFLSQFPFSPHGGAGCSLVERTSGAETR